MKNSKHTSRQDVDSHHVDRFWVKYPEIHRQWLEGLCPEISDAIAREGRKYLPIVKRGGVWTWDERGGEGNHES